MKCFSHFTTTTVLVAGLLLTVTSHAQAQTLANSVKSAAKLTKPTSTKPITTESATNTDPKDRVQWGEGPLPTPPPVTGMFSPTPTPTISVSLTGTLNNTAGTHRSRSTSVHSVPEPTTLGLLALGGLMLLRRRRRTRLSC